MYTIPKFNLALEPVVCWSGAFSDNELTDIIMLGDSLEFQQAKVGAVERTDENVRNSKVSWIMPDEHNAWLFNKMAELVSRINYDKFQFDLSHFDSFQYTTYTETGFYNWHIDGEYQDKFGPTCRKLGISILLSEPETDFTGGEFQVIPAGSIENIDTVVVKKGDLLAFPSFIPHRVNTITSGKRKSLVCWVNGPKFK